MNKYNNYTNELKRIGVPNYDGKQYEEYFKEIATSYVPCNLTGRQMAYVAVKMAAQKEFGSKKRMFIKQKDNNEVLCTVKVLINKYYSKLSLHCANDDLRPSMKNVCLDIRNGRVAASDGHTMMIKGLDVVSTEHFTYDYNLPLVNGKDFKKMCSLAKSGSTLTCKLVREPNGNTYWVSECCGYLYRCSFMLGYSTEQYAVGYCSK